MLNGDIRSSYLFPAVSGANESLTFLSAKDAGWPPKLPGFAARFTGGGTGEWPRLRVGFSGSAEVCEAGNVIVRGCGLGVAERLGILKFRKPPNGDSERDVPGLRNSSNDVRLESGERGRGSFDFDGGRGESTVTTGGVHLGDFGGESGRTGAGCRPKVSARSVAFASAVLASWLLTLCEEGSQTGMLLLGMSRDARVGGASSTPLPGHCLPAGGLLIDLCLGDGAIESPLPSKRLRREDTGF